MVARRILIAEEVERYRGVMREALSQPGSSFEVRFVASVAECRQLAASWSPEIIVANWLLPDGFGMDLLRAGALAVPPPVVLLISYGNEELGPQALEGGAMDYVVKSPANLAELAHVVHRALHTWRLHEERDEAVRRARVCMAQMRALFDAALDVILVVDGEDGRIRRVNRRAESVWGYTPEALEGQPLRKLIPPDEPGPLGQLETFGATVEPIAFLRADGSRCLMDVTATLVDWEDGRAVVAICRECGERIASGVERLREVAREAERRRIDAVAALIGGTAHEISSPAHYVLASAQTLEQAWRDVAAPLAKHAKAHPGQPIAGMPAGEFLAQAPSLFQGVIEGTHRIRTILEHMRQFADVLTEAPRERLAVETFTRAAADQCRGTLLAATEHFTLDVTDGLPEVVGNAARLRLALVQLLENACQATVDPGQPITLRATYDGERACVVISVEDRGTGIRPQLLGQVREPFFTTWRATGRLGLGLPLAETIAGQHGGSLELAPAGGGFAGTRASLLLPAIAAEGASA